MLVYINIKNFLVSFINNKNAKKKTKKSIFQEFVIILLPGFLVLIPIGITLYLTIFLIKISSKLIPQAINPDQFFPYEIPGLEILNCFNFNYINWMAIFNIYWTKTSFFLKTF